MTTPRPLPPMDYTPHWYSNRLLFDTAFDDEPFPPPTTWWDRTSDRLIDWMTPGRFWGIYACLILAALLGALALS